MEIRSLHTLKTAEDTPLEIELAGIGNRMLAFMVDFLAMGLLSGASTLALLALAFVDKELPKTLIPLVLFLIFFGYHLLQEWLWNGKTLGKTCFKIRVVRENGQPIGFWESLGRNLFRLIDVYATGLGIFPMLISPREKRFGDFLAGTLVINDQPIEKPVLLTAGENALRQGVALTPAEYQLLQSYLFRSRRFTPQANQGLKTELAAYFKNRFPSLAGEEDEALLAHLYQAYPAQ